MKKSLTLISLLLTTISFVFAQATQKSKSAVTPAKKEATAATPAKTPLKEGPQMEFKFTEHNFGELPEGPKASVDFVFTNTGNKPLILTDVKASCGCTTPDWPKEPILPGQTSKIKVEYNTQGRPGEFTKSITITSNIDDGQPRMIYIKGKVIPSSTSPTHDMHDGHNH
jgi:hypothetical protein